MTPGNVGGIHWGGMCFDPQQNILITNINRLPAIIRLLRADSAKTIISGQEELMRAETGRQQGTPYILKDSICLILPGDRSICSSTRPGAPW